MSKKAHADLGASTSSRWFKCPGSPREIDKVPKELRTKSSSFADEGTAAHALLEKCIAEKKDAREFEGRYIKVFDDGAGYSNKTSFLKEGAFPEGNQNVFEVTDQMVECIQSALDHIKAEVKRLGKGSKVTSEVRVYPLADREDMYGTTDVAISGWDELVVIDYKHGAGVVVEVEGNTQLRYYALGAAREEEFAHQKVTYTIIQPRAQHADGPIRSETITMKELKAWGIELQQAVEKTEKPNARLRAGPHCRFCPAAPFCSELRSSVQEAAGADFDEEAVELEVDDDLDNLARLYKHVEMVDAWCRAVKAIAQQAVIQGQKIKGTKLVRGRSIRKLRDDVPEKKLVKRMINFGIDEKDIFAAPKVKSAAQIEKAVDKSQRKEFNRKFVVKPEGKIILVSEDDPREEVSVSPGDDFGDEGEEF